VRPPTAALRVANTGPVIPANTVGALFEPFRRRAPDRTVRTDEPASGHGLGLSIVAAITAAHRGGCLANPRPEGGLDITVTLPAAPHRRHAQAPAGRSPEGDPRIRL
jgi:signal transduction histidine kinase